MTRDGGPVGLLLAAGRGTRFDPERPVTASVGLAIARGFVEANGGTIAVESLPGQGTTFRISNMGDETDATIAELLRALDAVLG